MIELAPHHKTGLVINCPVMPATGFWGYGPNPYPNLIQLHQFGALVTNPITLRPRQHRAEPQIVEASGGIVVNSWPSNPGIKKIIRQNKNFWHNSRVPIIAHLPLDDPEDLARTANALDRIEALAGLELGLPTDVQISEIRPAINALLHHSELPILVKLPLKNAQRLAEAAINQGVDACILSIPSNGLAYTTQNGHLSGDFYGLGIVPHRATIVDTFHQTFPDIPLIACGGIHTYADVKLYLEMGACAVQLDTIIYIDPQQVQQILTLASNAQQPIL